MGSHKDLYIHSIKAIEEKHLFRLIVLDVSLLSEWKNEVPQALY